MKSILLLSSAGGVTGGFPSNQVIQFASDDGAQLTF